MTAYRYRCRCGHAGRWYRDPNGAVAAGEAHLGLDRATWPCREGYDTVSALTLERRDGAAVTAERF